MAYDINCVTFAGVTPVTATTPGSSVLFRVGSPLKGFNAKLTLNNVLTTAGTTTPTVTLEESDDDVTYTPTLTFDVPTFTTTGFPNGERQFEQTKKFSPTKKYARGRIALAGGTGPTLLPTLGFVPTEKG